MEPTGMPAASATRVVLKVSAPSLVRTSSAASRTSRSRARLRAWVGGLRRGGSGRGVTVGLEVRIPVRDHGPSEGSVVCFPRIWRKIDLAHDESEVTFMLSWVDGGGKRPPRAC